MLKRMIWLAVLFMVMSVSEGCLTSTPTVTPDTTILSPTVTIGAPTATIVPATSTSVPPTSTSVPATTTSAAPTATSTSPGLSFGQVYLIVMENKGYGEIVGNADAPYINSLIDKYGLATNYKAVAHPSQPNYVALFSGSTQGVVTDGIYNLAGQNLADQLEAHGKTWQVVAQNVPLDCFTGAVASDGEDGTGTYARKHEPAIGFTDISTAPARCSHITNFSHFAPGAADFTFIAPNLCNDMHDCSIATGDTFLKNFVPTIINSNTWQQNSVLFIVWDEGEGVLASNQVVALVIANGVPSGFQSAMAHTHYSLLRTIEDAWGLGCLNQTCTANNLAEFFP